MDLPLTDELRERLAPEGGGGFVAARAVDATVVAAIANELGARHVVLDGPTKKRGLITALAEGLGVPASARPGWDGVEALLARPEPPLDGPIVITWLHPARLDAADAGTFRFMVDQAVAARNAAGTGHLVVVAGPALGATAAVGPAVPGLPEHIRGLGKVHHVALIVASIEGALTFWQEMLGLELESVMDIGHDRVRIAFLGVGESKIELVQPTDDTTGVARFLASKGEGFHHVCFEVANIAETLLRLEIDGLELIDQVPRRGAEGPVAFIHPRSCHGVLVELIEAPGGPAWRSLGMESPA
jgi:methylmalonyl-CoA epimerase